MDITSTSFSGHESFPFRNTWLTKGVNASADDPHAFSREEAMVSLGVGKNMVQSIRHWCLATKMIEEDPEVKNNRGRRLRPTQLAERLFLQDGGWDPYLEDMGSLWLVHWRLVTNLEKATSWYYLFNAWHQPEFTRNNLERSLNSFAKRFSTRVSQDTIKRDVDVLIRSYVADNRSQQSLEDSLDCPLSELGLVFESPDHGLYSFTRGPKDALPHAVVVFALWEYAHQRGDRTSFTFDELAYGPLSPGRVFKLDESSLAERLDLLPDLTDGAWRFSETAGLKQVFLTRPIDGNAILGRYYCEGAD